MARPEIEGEWVQSFIEEVEYFGAKVLPLVRELQVRQAASPTQDAKADPALVAA